MDQDMDVVRGLRKKIFGRYAKIDLLYRGSVDSYAPAVVLGTPASPGKICGKGPLLHVIFTPEGVFGMYNSRSWAPAGAWQTDGDCFLWTAIGGFRKCMVAKPGNNLHMDATGIRFGTAVQVHFAHLSTSYAKPYPDMFVGAAPAMHPVVNFTITEYMIFAVSPEDDFSGGINLGGAWTANYRDQLLTQVRNRRYRGLADDAVVNMLIIGRYGVGKSSWLNTVLSVFDGYLSQLLTAEPSNKSVTTELRRLPLDPSALAAIDVPGWDDDVNWPTYQRMLRCVVQGRAHNGEQLHPVSTALLQEMEEERQSAAFKDRPHVIIVLRPTSSASKEYDDKLKSIVDEYKDKVPVMVLMSKSDEFVPSAADLSAAYAVDEVLYSRKQLAGHLGVDELRILPVASYGKVDYPSVPVEIMALKALQLAQALGEKALVDEQMRKERARARNRTAGQPAQSATPVPPE